MARASLQRLIARRVLSLPAPVLRLLSGGGTMYQGGRTLDPRLQYLSARARRAQTVAALTVEEARLAAARTAAVLAGNAEPGVATEALSLEGADAHLPARLYRPARQDATIPLIVFAHGGGGVVGDLESSNAFCGILSRAARAPVLSVDYRLAPEHRFPAALDDFMAAYRWARGNAARLGAPDGVAAVGGVSLGATLAAVTAQDLRRTGRPQPALQLLVCPGVDLACESASMTTYADAYPAPRAAREWAMGHYVGPEADPADPRLSPLRAPDLSGLAPAVVVTAGFDPLLDQGEAYARALRQAGVPVVYRCYDNLAHGFTGFTGAVPAADVACREIGGLVREGLEGRIA